MPKMLLSALLLTTSLAHAEPLNFDANFCEFYVDGIASSFTYYLGFSRTELRADIVVRDTQIQSLGMWLRYRDASSGEERVATQIIPLKAPYFAHPTTLTFTIQEQLMPQFFGDNPQPTLREPIEVAFFADYATERRAWLSNRGQNFSYKSIMAAPTYPMSMGRMTITWANQSSALFAQKRACAAN